MQDITTALRTLSHRPGFTAVAVITLALGLGANAAIFSIIDAVLLRPLPYPDAHRLVLPWGYSAEVQQRTGFDRLPWSPGDVTDLIARNRTFQHLAWVRADRVNLTGSAEAERLGAARVSRQFFEALGVNAVRGRTFADADLIGAGTAVISERLWWRRFGSDPLILGRSISLNGAPHVVVGVLPAAFGFPAAGDLPAGFGFSQDPEVWILDILAPQVQQLRAGKSFVLIGRLQDGITGQQAQADLDSIAADMARAFPASNAGWTVRMLTLREQLVGNLRPALMALVTGVGFVLLIACANVANLLLVRASARQREVCVRHALGADRRRLIRLLLVESAVLGLASGVAALAVARGAVRLLLSIAPPGVPALSGVVVDWRVAVFTLVLSLATGVLFGAVPAAQATRLDVSEGLREGARGAIGGRRAARMRNALIVVEVAMAVVLLVGAVLLLQTFVRLVRVDPGFRSDGVLTAEVALPRRAYPDERAARFFEAVASRLASVPGIEAAAVTSSLPLAGTENLRQATVEGHPRPAPGQELVTDYRAVTRDYFRVMGIPHIAGDPLGGGSAGNDSALLVSQMLADTWFRGENPIGRRIKLTAYDQPGPWLTITGVVSDTRHTSLNSAVRPQVYVPHRAQPYPQMVIVMRASGDPTTYTPVVRAAVHAEDPTQPVTRVRTMASIVRDSVASRRFTMFLAATFALLALILALVGLYAVVAHSVTERTREMGVRMALGATPSSLLRLVIGEALRVVAVGVVLGLGSAAVVARFMNALLFGVSANDPGTFIGVTVLLFVFASIGCLVPARRAMHVDPMTALRAD